MSLDGTELHLVDSVEDALEMFRWLSGSPAQRGVIALDTESSGLSPEEDRVRLVQVSDDRTGWAIPFEEWRGVVRDLVRRWTGRIRMHHASFDVSMLDAEGIRCDRSRVDDTRLAGHVLEPTESTALKNQASRHVDPRAAALQRELDDAMQKWTWGTVPIVHEGPMAIYWQYGALDPILTYQLGDVHIPRVQREAPRAYELELAVSWVVSDMERRGARIDREYTSEHFASVGRYVLECERWCLENYGVKPGSNQAIIDILQREGFRFTKRTDAGALSLDKEVIAGIDHPLAQIVLSRRQAQKVQSTYLRRFLEYSEFDGYLHPRINTVGGSHKETGTAEGLFGVRTGRMSMDRPNLQQLPRRNQRNVFADLVRNCVVARDDHTLLMSDFDQIEMRILAHLADDPGMRQAFASDVDFFTQMARTIFADQSIEKKDPRRQTTKNSGYAKAYGAGPARFAETAGIPLEEAFAFLGKFDALYPGVSRLQAQVEQVAVQRLLREGAAYVRSPLTGRRHVADANRHYALLNYLIQGTAAEVFKLKLLELDAAGLGEYMILPVHDEIILDVPLDRERAVIDAMREVMNDDTMLSVPVTAGIARGSRWGSKEDVHV